MSRANSERTWRQIPQGGAPSSSPVTMAHATGSRSPAAIICMMAPRSAQIVAP